MNRSAEIEQTKRLLKSMLGQFFPREPIVSSGGVN